MDSATSHRYLLRRVLAITTAFSLALLTACMITPRLDYALVCQVSDAQGRRHIGFYSFYHKMLYPIVAAPIQNEPGREVIFRSEWGTKKLFPSVDVGEYFLSTQICQDSRIIGETVYVYPVHADLMGTPNVIAVSEDGGRHFDLRPRPHDESPPVIVDPEGYLFSIAWYDKKIEFISDKEVQLEQVVSLRTQSPYACPQCPPVVWRRFKTFDAGKTWQLLEYKILRPELMPPTARVLFEKVQLKVDTSKKLPPYIKVVDVPRVHE